MSPFSLRLSLLSLLSFSSLSLLSQPHHNADRGRCCWLVRRREQNKIKNKIEKSSEIKLIITQIEAAVVGFSGDENNLFTWLDMNSDGFVTFDEGFGIYETIIEDGQVLQTE